MSLHTITITALKILPANNLCIWFTMPANLHYLPGQYITLVLTINGREVRRPYSVCDYNAAIHTACILVKLIENGEVSRYLHQHLKINDQLHLLAPNGRFVLPLAPLEYVYFFAAGNGIAPIIALIKQALLMPKLKVTLVYSNKSKSQAVFIDELQGLQKNYAQYFNVVWLFSDAKNLAQARLNRFMLEDMLKINNTNINSPNTLYFMCGPFVYMEMITITLLTLGVNPACLFKEIFTPGDDEEDDEGSLLADKETPVFVEAQVSIYAQNQKHIITVKQHQTILQAAIENNIALPYSCSSGMCSSCVCNITQGKVYLHYNQVLTDNDIAQGRILTCTAHPTTNSIELDYNN